MDIKYTLFVIVITNNLMAVNSQYMNLDHRGSGSECLSCINSACRKVTGLFTRPVLPLGYNMIASIPAKSCNITIREVARS